MPRDEAISVAALVGVAVAIYVIRAGMRRSLGKPKPTEEPLES
jgi:hypothetical protein